MIPNDEPVARATALLVDDHEDARDMLALLLGFNGFEVRCADSFQSAINALNLGPVDVVITELYMAGQYVEGLCERVKDLRSMQQCFVLGYSTGYPPGGVNALAAAGFDGFLMKPAMIQEFLRVLPNRWATLPPLHGRARSV